jgi:hypothetical protein
MAPRGRSSKVVSQEAERSSPGISGLGGAYGIPGNGAHAERPYCRPGSESLAGSIFLNNLEKTDGGLS